MQTPKLDEFPLERQTTKEKSQNREMDSIGSKHIERQVLNKPSQDGYGDQRIGKHADDERLKNPKFTGYFKGKPT